jgi:anti-sigma B factor antagonist
MRKTTAKPPSDKDVKRLVLEGDFTIYQAPENKQNLLETLEQTKVLELDLSKVGEIDSAGLQVLLLVKRESLAVGKELHIIAHSPAVQEVLEFLNVASYFGDPLVISARKHP